MIPRRRPGPGPGPRNAVSNAGTQPARRLTAGGPSPIVTPMERIALARTDAEIERKASDSEPFSALAFKIMTDPFVGQLCFFRVYSGTLNSGSYIYNSTKGKKERIGRLLKIHANKREEINEV